MFDAMWLNLSMLACPGRTLRKALDLTEKAKYIELAQRMVSARQEERRQALEGSQGLGITPAAEPATCSAELSTVQLPDHAGPIITEAIAAYSDLLGCHVDVTTVLGRGTYGLVRLAVVVGTKLDYAVKFATATDALKDLGREG